MIDADNVKQRFPFWVPAAKRAVTYVTDEPVRFFESEDMVTTDGVIRVEPGDYYIALDAHENPYPVAIDVFESTYEIVGDVERLS